MFHTIILIGNLGRDPEMRYTPSGQAVTSFPVASNRQYTGSDGQTIKETIWFRISTWGKSAESCNNNLQKGSRVLVEGRLIPDQDTGGPRVYTRQDGTPASSFEISASTVRFLSPRGDSQAGASSDEGATPVDESDIPF